jgi:CBS domain-containing protein
VLCPVCRHDNFEGEDTCINCGADLRASDIPQAPTEYRGPALGVALDTLGIAEPATIAPSVSAADAIQRMHAEGLDALLVCEGDRLVGIFTDRDAVLKAAGKQLRSFDVRDFMTPDPVVLRHDETLAVAINKMAVGGFRHIPIVDGDRPVGVVAAADVFRHLSATIES